MKIKYHLAVLQPRAARAPDGRAAALLARGEIDGEFVLVDEVAHREILEKFPQKLPFRYDPAQLTLPDNLRPVGFAEFILARAKNENGLLVLDKLTHRHLQHVFYPPPPPPQDPTAAALAVNFTHAMTDWAKAGFKVVSQEEYQRRHGVCVACEHWDAAARLGLGKCKKCFCTKFKLWLATSKCPDRPPRW